MGKLGDYLDPSRYIRILQETPEEKKMNFLMTVATIGTGYLLYKNYMAITEIKEKRRGRFERSPESGLSLEKRVRPNDSRNIFQKIYNLGGLFDSLEDLDRILNVLWVPSIGRGLGFRFGKIISRQPHSDWNLTEITRASNDNDRKSGTNASELHHSEIDLPDNINYLMRLSRVFGHWALEDVLRLNEDVEYVHLSSHSMLFNINETDDSFYIILSGCIQLRFKDEETSADDEPQLLKQLHPGDHIMSLMSFIDFIMDKNGTYRSVQAVAITDSVVMRIPMASVAKRLMSNERTLIRAIQRIIRRSFEVMLVASHQVLGLTKELIKDKPRKPVKNLDDIPALQKPSAKIVAEAAEQLIRCLHTDDPAILEECTVLVAPAGLVLWERGQTEVRYVVLVIQGELEVALRSLSFGNNSNPKNKTPLASEKSFYIGSGEVVGALAFLTDDARQFSVRTSTKTIFVTIPTATLYGILDKNPLIVTKLVDSIFGRLSNFARQLDFGFEWTYFESGQKIFKPGDEPLATYLVLTGRVRSLDENNSSEFGQVVTEYGICDFIGLVEMWTQRKRTKTVLAVRDTEVAKIPYDFLKYICQKHANVTFQLLQYLTHRIVNTYKTKADLNSLYQFSGTNIKLDPLGEDGSRSTYAIFPASADVPVHYIAKEFGQQFEAYGSIMIVDSEFVKRKLGEDCLEDGSCVGVTSWLSFLETKFAKILYVADPGPSNWSKKCFHQADVIFIAVNNDGDKEVSEVESMILERKSVTRKELIICHRFVEGMPERRPRYTKLWLESRPWISFHHHVMISSKFYELNNSPEKLGKVPGKYFGNHRDIARLVRWLTGNALGVALGGGGAKGAAHIGFLREFLKSCVPIDMICGVSIGSFIAALYAVYQDMDKVEHIARIWFLEVIKTRKYIMDMTFPYVSLFSGESINGSLVEIFGDIQIEDLRIPFFTCTTDLSNNSIRQHRTGSLWRFVRASMTLVNYFPPICDPKDGHYLIDGGYTNMVPADMMRSMGIKYILALDISSKAIHYRDTNYGDAVSGINVLSHLTPVLAPVKVPTIFEIQSRLTWAQSVVYLNLVKRLEMVESAENAPSILYVRLPVDFYSTSDFKRFDNIREIGSSFGKNILEHIKPGDTLDVIWNWLKFNRENYCFGLRTLSERLQKDDSDESRDHSRTSVVGVQSEWKWHDDVFRKKTQSFIFPQRSIADMEREVLETYGSRVRL